MAADEPMEDEDSFHRPVPNSRPFMSQIPPPAPKKDSDPDSDDSFESFAPTQSTGGSTKSSGSDQKPPIPSLPPKFVPSSSTQLGIPVGKAFGMTQRIMTPSSPSSFSRHRSVNSGLRNSQFPTPGNRPPDPRPATPSGENKMLRDQLTMEQQKLSKLQASFQKDKIVSEQKHKDEIAKLHAALKDQLKEIEVLKTANACRKPAPKTPLAAIPSTSNGDLKKVYPRFPMEKTPRRFVQPSSPLSAFRHPERDGDEDTFQVDVSFEPTATSTPKIAGPLRTGIRRPLELDEDPGRENARGAPTPKRKPIFEPTRNPRNRVQIEDEIRTIWDQIDDGQSVSDRVFPEQKQAEIEEKEENNDNEWVDRHLLRQMRNLDVRRTAEKITNRGRTKLLQKAEQRQAEDTRCSNCRIDERLGEKLADGEKEWEKLETQKWERAVRDAETPRVLQYHQVLQAVGRKGIAAMTGVQSHVQSVERDFEMRKSQIRRRSLEEIRNEKREKWRTVMMGELREKGELEADLEAGGNEWNDDCIWTSDSEDENWQFPAPYDHHLRSLCSDCLRNQRVHRRIAKREHEKTLLKTDCLSKYGEEKRDELRNMSILTKSKMEAAEHELHRNVDEMFASRLLEEDEDGDEDDIF